MDIQALVAGTQHLRELVGLRHDPVAFFYTDQPPEGYQPPAGPHSCLVGFLSRAHRGETVYFDRDTVGCGGGGYYLGFCPARPGIDEFVSTGVPGQVEGEHYKQSPELVRAFREQHPPRPAPARYAVFRPVSRLHENDLPELVVCLAGPDELAGLVGLANYARPEEAVLLPFGSGCSAMISRPLAEAARPQPRAFLGLFDPSARPFVAADELSFTAPLALWLEMLANADQSFLQTKTWATLRRRLARHAPGNQVAIAHDQEGNQA
jgi:uncharacterized protein (DUF169 family)